eukprot:TRINITY_DN3302_c0_g1_i2.p1 TRINITY_DN3302_c0_g1~~TRINITY_DN3302_c0_g1_i2.p1  ORF type:complete len:102 (-),score=10.85 TRINITY_DN3302_c0_g1_i2:252-557(-)
MIPPRVVPARFEQWRPEFLEWIRSAQHPQELDPTPSQAKAYLLNLAREWIDGANFEDLALLLRCLERECAHVPALQPFGDHVVRSIQDLVAQANNGSSIAL